MSESVSAFGQFHHLSYQLCISDLLWKTINVLCYALARPEILHYLLSCSINCMYFPLYYDGIGYNMIDNSSSQMQMTMECYATNFEDDDVMIALEAFGIARFEGIQELFDGPTTMEDLINESFERDV